MSRILRCLLCFLVICCLVINLSPIKADATSAGLLAPIFSSAAVTVSAPVAIAAGLIALGIMVGTNDDFQRVVGNAVDSIGDWVMDGTVELIQTVDEFGNKSYYAAAEMMEALRVYSIETDVIQPKELVLDGVKYPTAEALAYCESFPYSCLVYYKLNDYLTYNLYVSYETPFTVTSSYPDGGGLSIRPTNADATWYSYESYGLSASKTGVCFSGNSSYKLVSAQDFGTLAAKYSTALDLKLGQVSTVPVDGTSARQWSEEYTNRGLYIVPGSGGSSTPPDGDDNNNKGKWYWPVVLGTTVAGVATLTQQDQWTGETPQEFDDYTTKTEFEILSRPEVEFGTGIELQPVTDPEPDPGGDSGEDPGTDPGTGTDPDPGTNPNPDPGTNPNPDPGTNPNPDPGTDPGTDPDSGTDPDAWQPSGDIPDFTLDLKDYFPFCIPFDLYDFFTCLNAEPVAPVINWVIPMPGGDSYPLELDLSTFDSVAQLLRRLQLLAFCIGLAFKTRDLIKG